MLRTAAQRRPTTGVSHRDTTAADLLDRTGIIAASLPQRRRSPEGFGGADPETTDVLPVFTMPTPDLDLRPKSVVIHRRVKSWLAGGAAMALLGLGWISGNMFGTGQSEDASPLDTSQVMVAQPAPVPQPVPAQPAAAPVTVYVPVPVPDKASRSVSAGKPQSDSQPHATKKTTTADPRVDTPAPSTSSKPKDPAQQMQELIDPFMDAANNWMPGNR